MTNSEIAKLLSHVSAAYSILDNKKHYFQIIAYQKAAETIEHEPTELKELYNEGKLKDLPGVGESIKSHLEELFKKGKVTYFDDILFQVPKAVFPLLDVPGFGPKKAYRLVTEFNLKKPDTVMDDLVKIAESGKIAGLPGFGEKSEKDILQSFKEYGMGKTKSARMVLPYATELARKMIDYLERSKDVKEVYPLGSLRRKKSTVGDIDIAASSKNPQAVLNYFASYPHTERVIEKGTRTSSILTSGNRQIDLMVEHPDGFGALLQHFTGSKDHNVHLREIALKKGYSLSDYGVKKKEDTKSKIKLFKTEQELYKFLGLQWVPPEIREDKGEIELAQKNKLPRLIELSDIKGDFHLHSSFPVEESHDPGQNSMEDMIKNAIFLKYKYLGFSEHNPSQSGHSNKQIYDLIAKRHEHIEKLRSKYNKSIQIFSLLETDIKPDGTLAVDDKSLSLLDGTIVSIHSAFSMNRQDMTKRVIQGLSHPKARILAHPTGRLINQREGYDLEWEKLFDFCQEKQKAIEINSWPQRLDLPDNLVQIARSKGVKFFINTDSHALPQMVLMEYGVSVARRGFCQRSDILNTFDYNKLRKWFNN